MKLTQKASRLAGAVALTSVAALALAALRVLGPRQHPEKPPLGR